MLRVVHQLPVCPLHAPVLLGQPGPHGADNEVDAQHVFLLHPNHDRCSSLVKVHFHHHPVVFGKVRHRFELLVAKGNIGRGLQLVQPEGRVFHGKSGPHGSAFLCRVLDVVGDHNLFSLRVERNLVDRVVEVNQNIAENFVISDDFIWEIFRQPQGVDVFVFQQGDDVGLENIRLTLELENDFHSIQLEPNLAELNFGQTFENPQHWFDRNFAIVFLEPIVCPLPEADKETLVEVGHNVSRVHRIDGLEAETGWQSLQLQLIADFRKEINRSR